MSNTYAQIKKEITHKTIGYPEYTNNMDLSLTAFMGGKEIVQLTIQINSTIPGQSGIGYITLTADECSDLILALQERMNGEISATGNEQSKYIPSID